MLNLEELRALKARVDDAYFESGGIAVNALEEARNQLAALIAEAEQKEQKRG